MPPRIEINGRGGGGVSGGSFLGGFVGNSVIGCGCEAGIERELAPHETPDGRPGIAVLLFAVSTGELQKQLSARVAQCVLTSPGSACYAGLAGEETLRLGNALATKRACSPATG